MSDDIKKVERSWDVDPDYQTALLVEYEAIQEKIIHSDNLTWKRATIILAANLASYAVVAINHQYLFHFFNLGIFGIAVWFTGLIVIWYLWDDRLYQKVMMNYQRMHEIEKMLGLHQHLSIHEADQKKKRKGLTGHRLAFILILWLAAAWWILAISSYWYNITQ